MSKTRKAVREQMDIVYKKVDEQATKLKDQKKMLEESLKEVNDLQKRNDSLEKEIQKALSFCLKKREILKQKSSKLRNSIDESEEKKKEIAEVKRMIKSSPKTSFEDIAPSLDKAHKLKTSIHKHLQEQQKSIPKKETIASINEEFLTIQTVMRDINNIRSPTKSTSAKKRPLKEEYEEKKRQHFDQQLQPVKVELSEDLSVDAPTADEIPANCATS